MFLLNISVFFILFSGSNAISPGIHSTDSISSVNGKTSPYISFISNLYYLLSDKANIRQKQIMSGKAFHNINGKVTDVFADFYADSIAVPFFAQSSPAGYVALLQSVPASFQESPYDGDSFLPVIYVDYPSDHRLFAKSLSKS